jgi:hypothetical protein
MGAGRASAAASTGGRFGFGERFNAVYLRQIAVAKNARRGIRRQSGMTCEACNQKKKAKAANEALQQEYQKNLAAGKVVPRPVKKTFHGSHAEGCPERERQKKKQMKKEMDRQHNTGHEQTDKVKHPTLYTHGLMHVYIYIGVCVCVCCLRVCVCVCVCVYIYIYIYILYALNIYIYIYTYVCMYVWF